MNQRQAGNVLRRNAPPGEHPAFINPMEANWLKGMGGLGKKTKSGLRSYAAPDQIEGSTTNLLGNEISVDTQNAEHERVRKLGIPPLPTPNISNPNIPNPLTGGTETRTPAGPGSVTNPNDPYGVQEAVATGAKDLINKEYVAPTLTPEERIASTSDQTLEARTAVDEMVGTGQDAYKRAAGVGEEVGNYASDTVGPQSFLSGKSVSEYANPHTQNVVDRNTQNTMDVLAKQRGRLVDKAQMAGAGTNDRASLERGEMAAQTLSGMGDLNAKLYSQGFDKAGAMKKYDMDSATGADQFNVKAGQTDQDIRLRGAGTEIAGTNAGRDAAGTDISLLAGVGADVEGREQAVKDGTMEDFYEERDWGENKLASAANIAGTNPTGSTTETTGAPEYKKKDKFGNIISGAATGWLASGGNPWGAAVGGLGGALS